MYKKLFEKEKKSLEQAHNECRSTARNSDPIRKLLTLGHVKTVNFLNFLIPMYALKLMPSAIHFHSFIKVLERVSKSFIS